MKKLFGFTCLCCFFLISCSKTNEVTQSSSSSSSTGSAGGCDTVNMKYAANVLPIIQANCYSCHGNGLSTDGISLDSYDKLKKQADNGNLTNVITHANGYPAMPYNEPKLADCDINKIKDWIARGTNNN